MRKGYGKLILMDWVDVKENPYYYAAVFYIERPLTSASLFNSPLYWCYVRLYRPIYPLVGLGEQSLIN